MGMIISILVHYDSYEIVVQEDIAQDDLQSFGKEKKNIKAEVQPKLRHK